MNERLTPEHMADLPRHDAGEFADAPLSAGAGDLKRGFSKLPMQRRPMREDSDGTTYDGEQWEKGGFLPRNYGSWDR